MSPPALHRTIVFSHANSFPARTYQALFERWQEQGYTVHAIEQYGHDPRYPVTPNWPHLVTQLRDFMSQEVGHPAYLVGHSLGGYLSLMLASQHPQWSQGVVVMDSPILQGWRSAAVGLAKRFHLIDRVMPTRVAAQRTHECAHFARSPATLRPQTQVCGLPSPGPPGLPLTWAGSPAGASHLPPALPA